MEGAMVEVAMVEVAIEAAAAVRLPEAKAEE